MHLNFDLLVRDLGDAVFALDSKGFFTFANPAFYELTGMNAAELQGKPLNIIYKDTLDTFSMEFELELVQKKGMTVSEGWKRRNDDTLFWGEITLNASLNHRGRIAGYCGILRDTTLTKKEMNALKRSEEKFRLMVDSVKDYTIFFMDQNGYIRSWNEGGKKMKGYTEQEIIGKNFSIFYLREELESGKPARELEIAKETGKYEEEGWRVKKDGSVFWANILITALYNDENTLIGFSKVTRDLTERKRNEDALRISEERNRLLIEQVTDYGIFMMDDKGRIVSWNEGAKRIKGYEASEIIGKYFSIFYSEEDNMKGIPSHELAVARLKGKYETEGWRLRKDGTRFWANAVITSVYNKDGDHLGFSKVTRDLTERKEAERALRSSYENYRMLARELKNTNIELSTANQELEQFASIVSHDLQEPIRTIKSFLQLIDMKMSNEQFTDLKTYIGKSINAANRMRELIQNLLNYTQLGKSELVKTEVNVENLVNEALQNLKTSIDISRAEVTIDNRVRTVQGDKVQLVQLLQNLIGNAIKFTNTEKPRVSVASFAENGHVKFAISDNGIGMSEKDTAKIFEIFRRLNTKKNYPGSGIGLAICKKIVERHKGRIWPVSNQGSGTTFYFTLNEEKN